MESPIEMKIIKIENEDYYVLSLMIEGASTLYEMGSLKNLMAFHSVIAQVSKTILDESLQFKSNKKKGLH
jgi:hypothetical protein